MKNLKAFFVPLFLIVFGVTVFTSCDDDDPALTASVDVYIKDMKIESGVKYGINIDATANYQIQSATVKGPGSEGKEYQLTVATSKLYASFSPEDADYSAELPANGNYTYRIVSTSGEEVTGTDIVGTEKLNPISIQTTTMENHKLKLTWNKIDNADAYQVRLYSADKSTLLFAGGFLKNSTTEFEFGSSTASWGNGQSPVVGTNYVTEVIGIKIESGVSVNQLDNIQFITSDSKSITWE